MDQLPLPLDLKQLVSDFRGVKPVCAFWLGDTPLRLRWKSDDGFTWRYCWDGAPDFLTGRPVHPLTSPEWAERRRASAGP